MDARYFGLKIITHINPSLLEVPRIQLDKNFIWVTDEFRVKQNTYLLKMFGTKKIAFVFNSGLVVDGLTYESLKRRCVMIDDIGG